MSLFLLVVAARNSRALSYRLSRAGLRVCVRGRGPAVEAGSATPAVCRAVQSRARPPWAHASRISWARVLESTRQGVTGQAYRLHSQVGRQTETVPTLEPGGGDRSAARRCGLAADSAAISYIVHVQADSDYVGVALAIDKLRACALFCVRPTLSIEAPHTGHMRSVVPQGLSLPYARVANRAGRHASTSRSLENPHEIP